MKLIKKNYKTTFYYRTLLSCMLYKNFGLEKMKSRKSEFQSANENYF